VTYRILSAAEKDLTRAIKYYERASTGLGMEFLTEVERTIQRILLNPEAWMRVSPNCRRCRTRRFPYGVFYWIERNELVISAVLDLRTRPESWRKRL
jgi:toxin ParE1/3/4